MKVCNIICDSCPFSKTSMPGFLADYKISDFQIFMDKDFTFPCHKLVSHDIFAIEVQLLIQKEELLLCRGYVESMHRSAKLPRDPEFAKIVKNIELSQKSMSIFEFIKFHNRS